MKILIQQAGKLPILPDKIKRLYADFETSSGDDKLTSLNPWHNCTPIGLAVTWDDNPDAYFITHEVLRESWWLWHVLENTINWVNHNIKYDAHVLLNSYFPCLPKHLVLFDTLTLAKLVDSDRKFKGGYSLAVLARDWLDKDIFKYENELKATLNGSKDYGKVPIDIMSKYACEDVITNREIDLYIQKKLPRACYIIKDIEKETTKTLFHVERTGFHVNNHKIFAAALKGKSVLIQTLNDFEDEYEEQIEPHIPADLEKILCGVYNLPVLKKTPGGKACFDKKTLKKYLSLPETPRDFVDKCLQYRQINTFINGFIKPALRYQIEETIHASFTQTVRTGRMACREPNLQAMSGLAKKLIVPRPGKEFICVDYSQIEFRLIAHVAKEKSVIAAYNSNPLSDFHSLVADLCLLSRNDAKTINFATAYGMGERSTREALAINPATQDAVRNRGGSYNEELILYVKELREKYFDMFPKFKQASKRAMYDAQRVGYTTNLYGREVQLIDYERGYNGAHKAFNYIIQGTAADLFKECLNSLFKSLQGLVQFVALVHDELLLEVDAESNTKELHCAIADILEAPSIELSLPIRIELGTSANNWYEAKKSSKFVERELV